MIEHRWVGNDADHEACCTCGWLCTGELNGCEDAWQQHIGAPAPQPSGAAPQSPKVGDEVLVRGVIDCVNETPLWYGIAVANGINKKSVSHLLLTPAAPAAGRRDVTQGRLYEAQWWREQTHEGAICSPQDCTQCQRIAELRAALAAADEEGK